MGWLGLERGGATEATEADSAGRGGTSGEATEPAGWLGWLAGLAGLAGLGLQRAATSVPESSAPFGRGPRAVGPQPREVPREVSGALRGNQRCEPPGVLEVRAEV